MERTSFQNAPGGGAKCRIMIGVLLAAGMLAWAPTADAGYSRKYSGKGYSYRYYSYYSARYKKTHSHMLVYHPRQPRYVYYYNMQSKKYWGRCDLATGKYQQLCEQHKKPTVAEIPEDAFPPGGPMPPPEPGLEPMPLPPEACKEATGVSTAEPGRRSPPPYVRLPAASFGDVIGRVSD